MTLGKSASMGALSADPKIDQLKRKYANAGPSYFKNSAVGSSRGFFQTAGVILARPYKTGAVPAKPKNGNPGSSEYATQFGPKRYCYSSMDNKPLSKYDPMAYRSRNALPDIKLRANNSSTVDFDQGLFVDKKRQFYTTNSQYLTGDPVTVVSNPGILADQYAIRREQRAK
mmetsp:Transcript_18761/g.46909  ORF Transcript_18761/g.46909 Transcript_18761/m.46909 type:complete len:171 (-) Transcript_18761:503-1015(-)|eukprot:CAMPEP_0179000012 /NCGR_PEP_ID=MMETSP0795-20121207/10417_1 /TAXON_ID=88552 /ORGANISM="Amoebophrya sp., Strain Ameob2" /LENGTH=170 /DNA_ID=CAMNT_0020692925 /DNA_START=110 /DNA_END=622 /DNA_ORIENTATION=+